MVDVIFFDGVHTYQGVRFENDVHTEIVMKSMHGLTSGDDVATGTYGLLDVYIDRERAVLLYGHIE